MSVLRLSPPAQIAGIGAPGFSNRASRYFRALAAEWHARQVARHVASFSDDMLHDIGITRGEIDRVVREGRPRR